MVSNEQQQYGRLLSADEVEAAKYNELSCGVAFAGGAVYVCFSHPQTGNMTLINPQSRRGYLFDWGDLMALAQAAGIDEVENGAA